MHIFRKKPPSQKSAQDIVKKPFTINTLYRILSVLSLIIWDSAAAAAAVLIGFGINYGLTDLPDNDIKFLQQYTVLSIIIVLLSTFVCGCYAGVWRRAGIGEFSRLIIAVFIDNVIMAIIVLVKKIPLPPEYIAIVAMLQLLFITSARAAIRLFYWTYNRVSLIRRRNKMKRVLIYGAGQAGLDLVHKLEGHPEDNLRPVCFIDDNKLIWGKKIAGLPVIGGRDKIEDVIRDFNIREVIMAITTADSETVKEVLIKCHKMHCPLKRFGTIDDVNEKTLVNAPISDINLEDLLRRNSVQLNMKVVKGFIEGKTVLVTGGAGSIGSEICRQVLSFGAKKLIVFDICENGLFEIQNELREKFDESRFLIKLGSIRDRKRVNEIFEEFKPDVVFHAAAHKHVPMMELNPREAVKNNVFGTINVAQAAILFKAEKFILISTDKAVNPANIMGATKRIAEMTIQLFNRMSETDLAAVRFGNVLGSSGSVVPFFKKQIAEGGPVTVTHPEMRRYFMTIPEAVQLVLEAGAMADGGEIFVLDMGKPVLIYDLACDLIRLSGYEPDKDIKIIFTGLRPGEKLFEEISLAEEDVVKTPNNKIYICKPVEYNEFQLSDLIKKLDERLLNDDEQGVFGLVSRLVPTFKYKNKQK
ncbi:MAG TPA: nucleoside-diphosphate sugar epimerase/dehydratase [Ruminiclostridium sp.]|nr:nucleoside-diphosphate sugar epimerase/dehydratase [Ruminiclostridium sp.]